MESWELDYPRLYFYRKAPGCTLTHFQSADIIKKESKPDITEDRIFAVRITDHKYCSNDSR